MKIEEIQKAFEDFFKNYSPEEPHSTYQDEEGKTQKIYKNVYYVKNHDLKQMEH